MAVAARGGVRWVLDPDDDVACVRALSAAHDLAAGRIVCHTVPGASWSVMVRDLLCALGKNRDALSRDRLVGVGPTLLEVWLRAEDVEHVVVLRAHTLPPAVLEALAGLAITAALTVWLVWHTREPPPPTAGTVGPPVYWSWAAAMLRPPETRPATAADHTVCEVYGRARARARLDARTWAIRVPWVEPRYVQPGCPLSVVLQRLTIDATSHDELLTRLHAAQTGFRDEGLSLDLPALADHGRVAALGPRLDPTTMAELRRFACPTTAAALMLALATDANSHQLAMASASWTCRAGRHIRFLGGTYRIPPRARPLLRAAVLTADHPATLLRDHRGRLFLPRRMANLVRRGASRAAVPEPPGARPTSMWDRVEPYAPAFTATASITQHQTS